MTETRNKPSPAKSLISRHKPKRREKKTIEGTILTEKNLKYFMRKDVKTIIFYFFIFYIWAYIIFNALN